MATTKTPIPTTNGHRRLLSPQETAEILGVSWRSLERWRQNGSGPPHVRLTKRKIAYRQRDVEAWVNSRLRASTVAERPPAEAAS